MRGKMKKCLTCGKEFSDNQIFCTNCGSKLTDNSSASTGTPQTKTDSASIISFQTKTDSASKSATKSKPAKHSKGPIVILLIMLFAAIIIIIYIWLEKDYYKDYKDMYDSTRWRLNAKESELKQAQSKLEQAESELKQAQSELEATKLDLEAAQFSLEVTQSELEKLSDLQGLYGYGSENYYAEQSVVVLKENESKEVAIYCTIYNESLYRTNSSYSGISSVWGKEWSEHKIQLTITGKLAGFYTIKFTLEKSSDSFEILVIVLE